MEHLLTKIKSYLFFNLFTVGLRFLIGGAFLFASIPKVMGERFTQIPTDDPVGAFFECIYSLTIYWSFLGWSQIVAGLLLITQRFALLGAMIFFGIILNIFFITLSLNMRGTPTVTFLMLSATAWLLLWDFDKWKYIFLPSTSSVNTVKITDPNFSVHTKLFGGLGILLLATGLFLLVYLKNIKIWFLVTVLEILVAVGISFYLHKKGKTLRV